MQDYNQLLKIARRIITDQDPETSFKTPSWIDNINVLDAYFMILTKRSYLSSKRRKQITKACNEYSKVFTPLVHELKCWKEHFEPIKKGLKKMELRPNDRNYQTGHILILKEWDPAAETYSGDQIIVQVTHVFSKKDHPFFDLKHYVIMSFKY